MNHTKEPLDYGEPWSRSSYRNCVYTRDGKLEDIIDHVRDRCMDCVNACAGIENPAEAIKAAREALEAVSKHLGAFINSLCDITDCSADNLALQQAERALTLLGKEQP